MGTALNPIKIDDAYGNFGAQSLFSTPHITMGNETLIAANGFVPTVTTYPEILPLNNFTEPETIGKYIYHSTLPKDEDDFYNRVATNIMQAEGPDVRWVYVDTNRNVTVGSGFLVKNYEEFKKYPFHKVVNGVVTNIPITDDERRILWNKLQEYATPKCPAPLPNETNKCKEFYQKYTGSGQKEYFDTWQLTDTDNAQILDDAISTRYTNVQNSINGTPYNLEDFGPWGQELFINGMYNEGKTPDKIVGFRKAVWDNDWEYIAKQYFNKDIGEDRKAYYLELARREMEYQKRLGKKSAQSRAAAKGYTRETITPPPKVK